MRPLILWGGTDINPVIYGESPLPTTDKPDSRRDQVEVEEVFKAIREKRPIIGVCRGAQLLCALNEGKLLQHVPYHTNNSHPIFTYDDKIFYNVAADHHQVMIPAGDFVIYATSYDDYAPEVVYWPKTRCLAVQPHPEWNPKDHPFNEWLNKLIKTLFNEENVF